MLSLTDWLLVTSVSFIFPVYALGIKNNPYFVGVWNPAAATFMSLLYTQVPGEAKCTAWP